MNAFINVNGYRTFIIQFARIALVALGVLVPTIAICEETNNAPTKWQPLTEVIKRWESTPLEDIERAAEGGDLTAEHYLGYCYCEGVRFPQDTKLGASWYQRAGDAGYMPSFNNLGYLYQRGKGVPQDYAKSLVYYQRASDGGFANAMLSIGYFYRDGLGVPRDPEEAQKWYRKAAETGSALAQCVLGHSYEEQEYQDSKPNSFMGRNMPEAVLWYRRSAEQGWARGQYHLGLCYLEGMGVKRDEAQGLEWIRKAADQGYTDAMSKLAELYARGIGEPRGHTDEPMQILQRLAESGPSPDSEDWNQTANTYDEIVFRYCVGLGVERDLPAGAEWYGRGAFAGAYSLQDKVEYAPGKPHGGGEAFTSNPEGGNVAVVLSKNDPRNELLFPVLSLYLKAADAHGGSAARQIGEMYFAGRDAPRNPEKAWAWFTLAAQRGNEDAHSRISELEGRMTADEPAEARQILTELTQQLDKVAAALNSKGE